MTFIPASQASVLAFLLIVVFVIVAALCGIYYSSERENRTKNTSLLGFGIFTWLILISIAVGSGFIEASPIPRVFIFLGLSNIIGIVLAFSQWGKQIAIRTPIALLVGFQIFRLPLEIVLHTWSQQGVIPATMTWNGANLDIISGILALICAPLAVRHKTAAWIANVVGFLLLLNVGRVAILSSPLPFAWQVEPPLLLAFHLPYAWIVPVCVAGALTGHLLLTRALFLRRPLNPRRLAR